LAAGKLRDGWREREKERERELFKIVAQNSKYKTNAGTATEAMHSSGAGK
jgi:hypothetical protein